MPEFKGVIYEDDRLYVLELRRAGDETDGKSWVLVTRENISEYYPPYKVNEFNTYDEARKHMDEVEPYTPRISLGGKSPDPAPSVEEFKKWVEDIGGRQNFDEMRSPGEPFFPGDVVVGYTSSATDGKE